MEKHHITKEELKEIEKLRKKYNTNNSTKINHTKKIKNKSIGKTKRSKKIIKTLNKSSQKYFYKRVLPVLITSCIAIILATYTFKDISDGGKLKEAMPIIIEEAKDNLEETGIITIDNDNNIIINTTYIETNNQNIKIDDPTISEAYAYKRFLEEHNISKNDSDYIASMMTYNNGKDRYKDWEDFCIINGLTNEKGKPSMKEFYETSKEEILEAYDDGNINDIVTDIEMTNTKTK